MIYGHAQALRTLGAVALASICGLSVKAQTAVGDRQDLVEIDGPLVFMQQPALQIGEPGDQHDQSWRVDAIAVDRWGNLYAVDSAVNTIRVWSYYTLNGEPLEIITSEAIESAGLGPLRGIRAIFAGAHNTLLQSTSLYLLDQRRDSNSTSRILMRPYLFSEQWVQLPFDEFQQTPHDFTIDDAGRLIVAESNGMVEVLLPDGNERDARFGVGGALHLDDFDGLVASSLVAVDTDAQGNIYVADRDNGRIIKLDANGNIKQGFGSRGDGRHQFHSPVAGVAVDWRGNVYGHDELPNAYLVFAPDGRFITRLAGRGFNLPRQPRTGDFIIDKISRRFIKTDTNTQRISIHAMTRDQFLSRNFTRQAMAKRSVLQPVAVSEDRYPAYYRGVTAEQNPTSAEKR